jgi:hypothetical protein
MCKKLMFLISFVAVVGLVSSASAIDWTNADPANDLWNTPNNWDGNAVPGGGDLAYMSSPPTQGPVIEADVTVDEIGGLIDQVMDISSGNVQVVWWWDLAKGGTGTTFLNMVGNANISIGGIEGGYSGTTVINIGGTTKIDSYDQWRLCNEEDATVYLNIFDNAYIHMCCEKNAWRFADKGYMVTNISGNPTIILENGKWRNSDYEDGFSEINMSGGSLWTERYLACYDQGGAKISFSGGSINVNGLSYRGSRDLPYELNVSGSGMPTLANPCPSTVTMPS